MLHCNSGRDSYRIREKAGLNPRIKKFDGRNLLTQLK